MTLPAPAADVARASLLGFSSRLRDLLATLESAALVGQSEVRMRGLGEHLRFACLALPCAEALVALEVETLGRLSVPVVADTQGYRRATLEFLPSGTPFAYLLGGGGAHAAELGPDDPMIAALRPALATKPTAGIFVPIRIGESTIGGAALFAADTPLGDHHLEMAERLAEVLALTVESFRTEQMIFSLFARALPDLLGADAPTSLRESLAQYIHALRLGPTYKERLQLALAVGKLCDRGPAEAMLCAEVLGRIDAYAASMGGVASYDGTP
ncbi:hypothetical protein [Polyangium mundeleinium]|uniref:GAF domain-containing protein n=1 Tax=Polyangium mundeleinium TaxID=2995306 RepID=A0ABT5EL38_9BACT|nr:hypothetical protein [Polyangium mundeleinium]MDC0742179.1 hypothetical protein [Polyangium mundeleinium]